MEGVDYTDILPIKTIDTTQMRFLTWTMTLMKLPSPQKHDRVMTIDNARGLSSVRK